MKLFSYLLVACAGLGLFACNTENDPVIENGDGVTKSVSLKLNGISGSLNTKAVEPGTPAAGKIVLKDLKIIFFCVTLCASAAHGYIRNHGFIAYKILGDLNHFKAGVIQIGGYAGI